MTRARPFCCPLCDSAESQVLPNESRLWRIEPPAGIVRCAECSLVLIWPPEFARGVQDDDEDVVVEIQPGTPAYHERDRRLRNRLAVINRHMGSKKGRLLDLGCGSGELLRLAEANGWEAYGCDTSAGAIRIARERGCTRVFHGTVDRAPFGSEPFDVVHCNHVIERATDPVRLVARISDLLRTGGLLVAEVHSEEVTGLPMRVKNLLGITRPEGSIFGRAEIASKPSPHRFFFDVQTFPRLVAAGGFAVMSTYRYLEPPTERANSFLNKGAHLLGLLAGYGNCVVCVARKPRVTVTAEGVPVGRISVRVSSPATGLA